MARSFQLLLPSEQSAALAVVHHGVLKSKKFGHSGLSVACEIARGSILLHVQYIYIAVQYTSDGAQLYCQTTVLRITRAAALRYSTMVLVRRSTVGLRLVQYY